MITNHSKFIKQTRIPTLFKAAYSKITTVEISQKSFHVTGLYPFNPNVFSEDYFVPIEVKDRAHETDKLTEMAN